MLGGGLTAGGVYGSPGPGSLMCSMILPLPSCCTAASLGSGEMKVGMLFVLAMTVSPYAENACMFCSLTFWFCSTVLS